MCVAMVSTLVVQSEMRVAIGLSSAQLHLRIVRTRATLILVLVDDSSAASQTLTSSLEVCHSLGGEDRCAVVLWRCVMAFVDWDSSVYNRRSDDLFLDHGLDCLVNYTSISGGFCTASERINVPWW